MNKSKDRSVQSSNVNNRIIIILFNIIFLFCFVQGQVIKESIPPPVEIAGTQLLKINSSITGQEYVLDINLPQGYNDTSKAFPVIYVLDGQWDFTLVTSIYGVQYYDGFLPSAIIVAITWGGENVDYDKRRAFDLTPTNAGQQTRFGNAEKFLSFIKNEAVPFIESRYRTKKNERTLVGHSFGGLFTLYALFCESELFNRYVSGSPAWGWDNGSLYTFADKFSKKELSRPIRVFMSVGEYEDVSGFERLMTSIKEFQIKDLELDKKVIQGAGHAGSKPEGFNRGLQFVFRRPCLNIEPKILERYAGEYETDPQNKGKITVENGRLVGYPGGNMRVELCAETEKDFYVIGGLLNIHFVEDKEGKVTGFQLQQYSGETFVKKINKF